MVVVHMQETSTAMSSVAHIKSDLAARDLELAAATGGDPTARWRALEACRDYLRLVVRRGRWSGRTSLGGTSDLVQNTVVDAWRDFSKFHGQTPGQLRAWLRAILVHAALNARRRRRDGQLGSGRQIEASLATKASPSQAAQKNASREELDEALGGLSERHRTVIHLRIWDQLSFARMGTILGISEDAARKLYGRALAKLRETMRPGHDPG
jgi:RNA polymerase sigma-70 factor, ECF subfamily